MRERLEQRIQELKTEFDAGQKMLVDLEQRRATLEQTLLRITGAIQVLEELLATETDAGRKSESGLSSSDATTA
jgi:septation ring formation regulator EzrA